MMLNTTRIPVRPHIRDIDLRNAVAKLPPHQRETVLMYLAGYTRKEMAVITDMDPSTHSFRMKRAIAALREELDPVAA